MAVLRRTAKLFNAMKATPVGDPAAANNRLGEWTASLIPVSCMRTSGFPPIACVRCLAWCHWIGAVN